jgi:predicted transcriptional regulator
MTPIRDRKLGGPCHKCGRAQIDCARQGCDVIGCAYNPNKIAPAQMRLARALRLLIAAENLEQKAVAEQIGINESTLSRFLSGRADPDAAGFARILSWSLQP